MEIIKIVSWILLSPLILVIILVILEVRIMLWLLFSPILLFSLAYEMTGNKDFKGAFESWLEAATI